MEETIKKFQDNFFKYNVQGILEFMKAICSENTVCSDQLICSD